MNNMSHILKDKIDLDVIRYFYDNLDTSNISKGFVIDILEEILPRDFCNQLLIEYDVKDNGLNPAIFYPGRDLISLSISKIDKWLKNNTESLGEYYKVSDLNLFSKYLFFYMVIHEIEHGYQFLIADDKIASPCVLVRDGYKGIFDLFDKKDTIIPRPIKESRRLFSLFLYKFHENEFVLERNANVESLDLICKLAKRLSDEKSYTVFLDMFYTFIKCGYLDNNKGILLNTYNSILMGDRVSKTDDYSDLSFEQRVRYGLPISSLEREKVLSLGKRK